MAGLKHSLNTNPAISAFSITPSDSADLAFAVRGIYVGGAGNVAVITLEGDTVTFTAPVPGRVLPVCVSRVLATGTTATSLVGMC